MAVSFSRCAEFGKGFVVVVVRQKFLRKKKREEQKRNDMQLLRPTRIVRQLYVHVLLERQRLPR